MLKGTVSAIMLILLLMGTLASAFSIKPVRSLENSWLDSAWTYRKQVNISETSGFSLTDFPVELSFEHNGHVQTDGRDIRVIENGAETPYCITGFNSTHATIMFQINLTSLSTKSIHVYYGNPSASTPSYPLVPLTISEGNNGHAIIDDRVYIGWGYTSWGWSNNVELWNDFRIDFNGNNDPTDDNDLIRDYESRQGGIARHRADIQAIGLGDYQGYIRTPIYIEIDFVDAMLRVYRNNPWVETTQADFLHMFSPSYDFGKCGIGTEQNMVDGEDLTYPDPGWFSTVVCNSKENPRWMAFRDSSSGYVFASTGFGIDNDYSHHQGGKETSDWDRAINYCNRSRYDPLGPYDQPVDCRIYWYGDNSNNYAKIEEMATILSNQPTVNVVPDTIIVPDDFAIIQEAINHANEGDTIFVRNGTYYENVIVNKTVSLIGECKETAIIDGNNTGTVVYVTACNVTIRGFRIRNSRNQWPYGGIVLDHASNCNISKNFIDDSGTGIYLYHSPNNTVLENNATNRNGNGIYLESSSNNHISGNDITNNAHGIGVESSSNNSVVENRITANDQYGLFLGFYSKYNSIIRNTIEKNWDGVYLYYESYPNNFYHNNFINNTRQVLDRVYNYANIWDNGCEGNYWSDYDGTDSNSDGIGGTPYVINGNNQDNYPLIHPYDSIQNLGTNLTHLTIQSAINAPETLDGHTIFVKSGIYYENIIVNKTVSLVGEDKSTTVIDGNGTGTVVLITENNVGFEGFTVQNSGNLRWDCGIYLFGSFYNYLANNTVRNNNNGIHIVGGSNVLRNNDMANNTYNFGVWGDSLSDFTQDIDTSNKVNGKPIYFYVNRNSETVPEDVGYLGIVNSQKITVSNLNISNNGEGILLAYSTDSLIEKVSISNNRFGIYLFSSSMSLLDENVMSDNEVGVYLSLSWNNVIDGNTIRGLTSQTSHGIELHMSNSNSIIGNTVRNASNGGIGIWGSNGNEVLHNEVEKNRIGIVLDSQNTIIVGNIIRDSYEGMQIQSGSHGNTIYHNNFISNVMQLRFTDPYSFDDIWDNGCEGNFWSNYNGTDTDEDGVGDIYIPWESVDSYPLMSPYLYADVNHDAVVNMRDIGLTCDAFASYPGHSNWNPHCDINEDGIVNMRDIGIACNNFMKKWL